MASLPIAIPAIVPDRKIVRVSFPSTTTLLAIKLFLHLVLTTTLRFFFGFRKSIW
jgi:hypothetical protein